MHGIAISLFFLNLLPEKKVPGRTMRYTYLPQCEFSQRNAFRQVWLTLITPKYAPSQPINHPFSAAHLRYLPY